MFLKMIQVQKMDKKDLLEILASNKKFFVLVFCVLFGVVSGESYKILKFPEQPKFKKILPKFIVALFVCALSTPILEYYKLDGIYPYCMLGLSIASFPILDWFINTFVPAILSTLQGIAVTFITKFTGTNKNKKDDTEQ